MAAYVCPSLSRVLELRLFVIDHAFRNSCVLNLLRGYCFRIVTTELAYFTSYIIGANVFGSSSFVINFVCFRDGRLFKHVFVLEITPFRSRVRVQRCMFLSDSFDALFHFLGTAVT